MTEWGTESNPRSTVPEATALTTNPVGWFMIGEKPEKQN